MLTLSVKELTEITHYKQPSKIIRELQRRGWPHEVALDGYPVVLRSIAESMLSGRPLVSAPTVNLAGLKRLAEKRGQT